MHSSADYLILRVAKSRRLCWLDFSRVLCRSQNEPASSEGDAQVLDTSNVLGGGRQVCWRRIPHDQHMGGVVLHRAGY